MRSCSPEPQRIDGLAAVADHWPIKWDTNQRGRPAGNGAQGPTDHLEGAVEFDFDRLVGTSNLPGILPTQPVVRLFMLPAVLDGLLEDAVFVTQPIAHRRQLHGRHRVEKASREAPEPAVSEAGIGFFFDEAEPIDVLLLGNSLHEAIEQKVCDIVGQRAPDQKFHRQVVDPLRVLAVVGAFRPHPALGEDIPCRAGGCLILFARACSVRSNDVVEQQVPLVQGVVGPGELDRTAAVLSKKVLPGVR